MITPQNRYAIYATMCSYLGLSARDLAEIGGFSERFARDLLAGRKPFPVDTQKALKHLYDDVKEIIKFSMEEVDKGEREFYIFRTNEQLRTSPAGAIWHPVGYAEGAFVGPYRAAMFEVWRRAAEEKFKPVNLVFAETPEAR